MYTSLAALPLLLAVGPALHSRLVGHLQLQCADQGSQREATGRLAAHLLKAARNTACLWQRRLQAWWESRGPVCVLWVSCGVILCTPTCWRVRKVVLMIRETTVCKLRFCRMQNGS